ncbi:MAG: S8 family serine peptidase [Kineosporiaceae bacterium]
MTAPEPDRDPAQPQEQRPRRTPLPPGVGRAGDRYGDYGFRLAELVVEVGDLERLREALPLLPSVVEIRDLRELPGGLALVTLATRGEGRDIPRVLEEIRDLPHDRFPDPLRVAPHHVLWGTMHVRIFRTTVPPAPAEPLRPQDPGEPLPGAGVRALVVDTPLDPEHPWLAGRVTPLDAASVRADPPALLPSGELPWYAGHGAFVTGVVLQHAPKAEVIHAGRVGPDGEIDDVTLADLIHTALDTIKPVDVVNLSLGGYVHPGSTLMATEAALARLREEWPDTVVVAAAGNDARSTPFYPAAAKGVIGVGALDGEKPACFTNTGTWVDACAPGVDGVSTFVRVEKAMPQAMDGSHKPCLERPLPPEPVTFDGYAVWSGTSVAAPRVSGAIAAAVVPGVVGAREAAFRLIGAAGLPRRRGLGAVVNPGRWG